MLVRCLEITGLLAFGGLMIASLRVLFDDPSGSAWISTLICLPLAYYAADFFTGWVHWVCDSFGSEKTPIWGPMLVGPFRRHHRQPLEITQISLVENLGASAIAGTVALGIWHPNAGDHGWGWHLWLWFLLFSFLSNLFHRWSHWPKAQKPHWMSRLQAWHVLLSTEEHLQHHRHPYRVNYCILSGWANGLTNRLPWARLESLLARIGIPTNFD